MLGSQYELRTEHPLIPSWCVVEKGSTLDAHCDCLIAKAFGVSFDTTRSDFAFPGAHPTSTTSSRLLDLVSKAPYTATYKIDGKRFLFVLTRLPCGTAKAVMVDRTMTKYEIATTAHRCYFEGTIFDGELCLHNQNACLHYVIFDAICVEGRSLCRVPFYERLQAIHDAVMDTTLLSKCDASLQQRVMEERNVAIMHDDPVRLRACPKAFWPCERVVKMWNERRNCPYDLDGILFVMCDANVANGRDTTQLKWKPHWTVDVILRRCETTGELTAFVLGKGGGRSLRDVSTLVGERRVMCRDNELTSSIRHEGDVVFECGVTMSDADVIHLDPMRERSDKLTPNGTRTVESTFASAADPDSRCRLLTLISEGFHASATGKKATEKSGGCRWNSTRRERSDSSCLGETGLS